MERSEIRYDSTDEMVQLACQIRTQFLNRSNETDAKLKWSLLKNYEAKYLSCDVSTSSTSSYCTILSVLLNALRPTLFSDTWQEKLFDDFFLKGIHHEAFMILVRRITEIGESYEKQKVISLLQKFVKGSQIESMFKYQCVNNGNWDLKYVSISKIWDDLITLIVSLPERIANETKGQMSKIFTSNFYIPLLVSAVMKTFIFVHERLSKSQGCSLTFLSKLMGKLCIIGHSDIVTKKFSAEMIKVSEKDFVWRKISQNFIRNMPLTSLESFIIKLLLNVPWYGYVEWIIGYAGIDNEKLNYIMTSKILFLQHFKQDIILQNIIGYFASSKERGSQFEKAFDAALKLWSDASTLKYHSFEQQNFLASTLMICAGWLKKNPLYCKRVYLEKVLSGTQIRIGSSEDSVRALGMIVGESLSSVLDPDAPKLEFEHLNSVLVVSLKALMEIPSKPESDYFLNTEDLKCFEEVEMERSKESQPVTESSKPKVTMMAPDGDSDDDLEPYDLSNDVPQEEAKRPLYLRDCMTGLIEQENPDWTEQCLKHAERLIRANSDTVHEIAVEMTKILLHLDDKYCISDFISLRHRALIRLAVTCPILVADYLTSQFYEKDYNIRQRLDILEVLAAASQELSQLTKVEVSEPQCSKERFDVSMEQHWKTIVDKRIEAKTRYITKKNKRPEFKSEENKFSCVAGHFFFALMEKYDKQNQMLKLFGEDSYVLGRLIYTLGIIMYSAANIPLSRQMGTVLLQFLLPIKSIDVFVRQAIIFAVATVYVSVPGYLLCSDMISEVMESVSFLRNIVDNDIDINCQIKASHALGLIIATISEEMPLSSLISGS